MGRKKKIKFVKVVKERVTGTGVDKEICSRCKKNFDKLEPGWLFITGYVCQDCVSEKKY